VEIVVGNTNGIVTIENVSTALKSAGLGVYDDWLMLWKWTNPTPFTVTFAPGVTQIGSSDSPKAFIDCTLLSSVTIPDSVTSIDSRAFKGCSALTVITIGTNNPNYSSEDGVLFNKDKSIIVVFPEGKGGAYTVPNSVTQIYGGFERCASLTSVTIPGSVTGSENYNFYGCTALTNIYVSPENPNYLSEDGVLYSKDKTKILTYPQKKSGAFAIPNSVTEIIGVFNDCTLLTSVTIPESVVTIQGTPFLGCTSLANISVNSNNPNYSSQDGVLFNKNKSQIFVHPVGKSGAYAIPNSVTTIRAAAFYGCLSLTNISIPSSVTYIQDKAFYGCTSLTSMTIPDSVVDIDFGHPFYDNTSLISINIGSGITGFWDEDFTNPNFLAYATSLKNISISPNNPSFTSEDGVVFNKTKTKLMVYPSGKSSYTIPDSVVVIDSHAFGGRVQPIKLFIPESVKTIGSPNGSSNLTIYCVKGSVAHTHAVENDIPFVLGNIPDSANTVPLSSTQISAIPDQIYDGKAKTPTLTVQYGSTQLIKDKDYTAEYLNNINVGTATVNLTGIGNYSGTKTATFNIISTSSDKPQDNSTPQYKPGDPKSPVPPVAITKAPKVKAKKKAVTVTIPKTAGATAYIIKYRTGKGKWKTVTVKGNNPKSKTIKKLKKGKKYTFRIQSIKKVGKKTYKAKWSKPKTVKVK
jgi:hypothetical protein